MHKISQRLHLRKEAVRSLTSPQLGRAWGGASVPNPTFGATCDCSRVMTCNSFDAACTANQCQFMSVNMPTCNAASLDCGNGGSP